MIIVISKQRMIDRMDEPRFKRGFPGLRLLYLICFKMTTDLLENFQAYIFKANVHNTVLLYSRCSVVGSVYKSGFEPQARHQNKIQKVFLRRFPLSRFLAKTPGINKIVMKSFSKNNLSFGVNFKLYVTLLLYKINIFYK